MQYQDSSNCEVVFSLAWPLHDPAAGFFDLHKL